MSGGEFERDDVIRKALGDIEGGGLTRLQAVIDACPVAMLEVEAQTGVIKRVNEAAVRLFGYSRDELVGNLVETLVPPESVAAHAEERHAYAKRPTGRAMAGRRLKARRKGGELVAVEIELKQISGAGTTLATIIPVRAQGA